MQATDMQHLLSRVAGWNAARYDQVYDKNLLCDLLLEELNETIAAYHSGDKVEAFDGLCDVSYVALGGIWKANVDGAQLGMSYNRAIEFCRTWQDSSVQLLGPTALVTACINSLNDESLPMHEVVTLCFAIMLLCFLQGAAWWGMGLDAFIQGMHCVCDSNDSKTVHKVAAHVKANANNKGSKFVPPTAGLTDILKRLGVL